MSRLIDADELIEELHHMIEGDVDLTKDYEYMGIDDYIRSMPTAYDVDKVVEEIARRDTTDGTVKVFSGREIIDIVKRGGVK